MVGVDSPAWADVGTGGSRPVSFLLGELDIDVVFP
jgi:hypothetical protein